MRMKERTILMGGTGIDNLRLVDSNGGTTVGDDKASPTFLRWDGMEKRVEEVIRQD
jgi:hypothetical protein